MTKLTHELTSEKYLLKSLQQDKNMARRIARRNVRNAVWNTTIVAVTAVAGYYAFKTMPDWLPLAQSTFHQITNYKFV